jgi:Rrf2 family protein
MRVSRKTEYALRALVAMAKRPQQSFQIQELSEQEAIPIKYLEQILLALRHAGFLSSKRGVGGGYSLRMNPGQIQVGEIIEIMDGPIAPVPCAALRPLEKCSCPDPRTCAVRLLMTELREEITALLGARTIEDMVKLSPDSNSLAFEI